MLDNKTFRLIRSRDESWTRATAEESRRKVFGSRLPVMPSYGEWYFVFGAMNRLLTRHGAHLLPRHNPITTKFLILVFIIRINI